MAEANERVDARCDRAGAVVSRDECAETKLDAVAWVAVAGLEVEASDLSVAREAE